MSPITPVLADRSLAEQINAAFADVAPGFVDTGDVPVMTTPALVPAAVVAVQGSTLCLIC